MKEKLQRKTDSGAPIRAVLSLLFAGTFLAWPLAYLYFLNPDMGQFYPRFGMFDNGVLALFAAFLLCRCGGKTAEFLRRRTLLDRMILSALGIFGLNLLLQQFFCFSLFRLASGGMIIALILFGGVFFEELKTLLPKFSFVLLILSLLQFSSDFFYHFRDATHVVAGLASNWNWSATLLTASAVLSVPLLPERWQNRKVLGGVLLGAGLLATLLIPDFPKGTWLGIAGGCFLLVELSLPKCPAQILFAAVLLMLCGTAAYFLCFPLPDFLSEDIRCYLFEGALKLGAAKFPFGCGQDLFCGQINAFLSPEYHLSGFVANIHNHPHNSFLLLFSEHGVAGICLIFAWIAGGLAVFFHLRKTQGFFGIVLLTAFGCFSLHGMVDMTLTAWPCRMLFLLLAGMLWHICGNPVLQSPIRPGRAGICVAAFFGILTFVLLSFTAIGGFFLWRGTRIDMAGRHRESQEDYQKSFVFKPTVKALYNYALNEFYYERNFVKAEQTLLKLFSMGYDSYIHSDYLLGRSRVEQGNYLGALPFYEREELCYPFGSVTFYDHSYALYQLGRKEEAARMMEICLLTLQMKNRVLSDIPLLRQQPKLDFRLPRKEVRKLRARLPRK